MIFYSKSELKQSEENFPSEDDDGDDGDDGKTNNISHKCLMLLMMYRIRSAV